MVYDDDRFYHFFCWSGIVVDVDKDFSVIILVRGQRQSGEPEIASPATGNHF